MCKTVWLPWLELVLVREPPSIVRTGFSRFPTADTLKWVELMVRVFCSLLG